MKNRCFLRPLRGFVTKFASSPQRFRPNTGMVTSVIFLLDVLPLPAPARRRGVMGMMVWSPVRAAQDLTCSVLPLDQRRVSAPLPPPVPSLGL